MRNKWQIPASDNVEGIHISNTNSNTFTISDSRGSFTIPVQLTNTLTFFSISYELKKVVVDVMLINSRFLNISLTESITILDEVIVGKVLTGDVRLDVLTSGVERDLNFYDFGIPGYLGKPKHKVNVNYTILIMDNMWYIPG